MKKSLTIIALVMYIFFLLGFLLHTSPMPIVFYKYSLKYFFVLVLLIAGIYPFVKLVQFLFYKSVFKIKNKKLFITPKNKFGILIIFLVILMFFAEALIRLIGVNTNDNPYTLQIDNVHPFLQATLTTRNNKENPALSIDSFGFRGEEIIKEKPENAYRIFVLGGSTVLNVQIPYRKTFAKLLEDKLQKEYPNKKIEVLNAGMDGFTTEHSIIQYLFYVKDFHPDLIITWQGINDMYYSCQNPAFVKSPYESDYSHQLGSLANVMHSYFDNLNSPIVVNFHLRIIDLLSHMFAYNFYSDINPRFNSSILMKIADLKLFPYKPISMNFSQSLGSYRRNLTTLIRETGEDKTPIIVGNQPFLYDMKLDNPKIPFQWYMQRSCLNKDNQYPNTKSLINGINIFNETTETVSKENNVIFLDLNSQIPKNSDYFLDDVHLNIKGNVKVEEILFKEIMQENLIQ
jgi:lysophospholipase L1-like esterase